MWPQQDAPLVARLTRRRRHSSRQHEHARISDGLREQQSAHRQDQQPVGSHAYPRRLQRRRSRGHRFRLLRWWSRQRRRRLDPCSRAFFRHLRPQAHAWPRPLDRTFSAGRRPALLAGCRRPNGPYDPRRPRLVRGNGWSGSWRRPIGANPAKACRQIRQEKTKRSARGFAGKQRSSESDTGNAGCRRPRRRISGSCGNDRRTHRVDRPRPRARHLVVLLRPGRRAFVPAPRSTVTKAN